MEGLRGPLTSMRLECESFHSHTSISFPDLHSSSFSIKLSLLWELYTGDKPWKGINRAHLAWEVTKEKKRPEFPIEAPREYVDLAVQCWADKASDRPTFEQAHRMILDMIKLVEEAMNSRPSAEGADVPPSHL